ncbi:MAG TPA: G1 family glutamic endopeptidase [Acidimicrobiales bacterium]|nr:G1 family glutamic endopeptidase [Acidimicrobiales bacterium]
MASDTSQQQWAITFSATNSAGQSATSTQTLTQVAPSSAPATTTLTQSQNWSGYVVPSSSSLVTQTSGEFTVPTLDCAATPNADVGIWVGTGGTGNAALLQTGVASSCVNGAQQDYGWWEEVPSNPNNAVNFTGFTVSPGDVIEASVFQMNTGAWETSVDDLTTGLTGIMRTGDGWGVSTGGSTGSFTPQGSTVGLSYSGAYTGEWIVEDPESNGSLATFADYGTVSFTNLTTSISSWSLTPGEGYEIVQANTVISTPSSPSNGAFSVTYTG